MFLMYVDESGDTGLVDSPTRYFVLTGLVLHELRWQTYIEQFIQFRQRMRASFGLKLREEIHATEFINRPGTLRRIAKNDRLSILRFLARELASMSDLNVINIVVDKQNKAMGYDCFTNAWRALIQRFENTLSHRNFRGPRNADERGLVLPDPTDDKKLTRLIRRLRKWNPVSNQMSPGFRNLQLKTIIEDPCFRDSRHSYFIQACDLLAYLLKQRLDPNKYMKKKGANTYFQLVDPILCKVAASTDPQGIVRL